MAVTKILARHGGLKMAIQYVMNGDKTEEKLLVAMHLCSQEHAYEDMVNTKKQHGLTDGVQYYHMILAFKPGEITPDLAMELAQQFVDEQLAEYETVIGVHTDRQHIHAHILFNSVQWGAKVKYTVMPNPTTPRYEPPQTACAGSTACPSSSKVMGRSP